jgi:manganese-dependent inorganic pyrophosphatase
MYSRESSSSDLDKEKIVYVFGHQAPDTDTICSAIVEANFEKETGNINQVIACRLGPINKETKFALEYFGFQEPKLITGASEADEVILVDHNNPGQSAKDIKQAKIVKIIDHHGIAGFSSPEPIYILTEPVGCCCTVLYKLYKDNDITIAKNYAGLMLSAIISDTVLLRSQTTTQRDIKAANKLAKIAEVNLEEYGKQLLTKGTDISDISDYDLVFQDSKEFPVGDEKIQISQINAYDPKDALRRKDGIKKVMQEYMDKNKALVLFLFDVLDIINMDSYAIVIGPKKSAVESAYHVEIGEDGVVFLQKVASRKKQLYPDIAHQLLNLQRKEKRNKEKAKLAEVKKEEKKEENKEENKEKEKKKKKKTQKSGGGRFQGLKKEMAERQKEIKNKKKKEDKE